MTEVHVSKYVCAGCDHVVAGSAAQPQMCPKCQGTRWKIDVGAHTRMRLSDELDGTAKNRDGDIVAERIEKTDLNTSSSLAADSGKPTSLSVHRVTRVDKFVEEGEASEAVAKAFNELHGTRYAIAPKAEEDGDYADRVLRSEQDEPKQLNIQVRHLDVQIIAQLGKEGKFGGELAPENLAAKVRDAIQKKALIDPKTKGNTLLALYVPAAIGQLCRADLESRRFDVRGFKEVWIAPFHEAAFPVQPE